MALYGALIGVWWWRLRDYFVARGHEGGVEKGNGTLAAIALLRHLCDVTLGRKVRVYEAWWRFWVRMGRGVFVESVALTPYPLRLF